MWWRGRILLGWLVLSYWLTARSFEDNAGIVGDLLARRTEPSAGDVGKRLADHLAEVGIPFGRDLLLTAVLAIHLIYIVLRYPASRITFKRSP